MWYNRSVASDDLIYTHWHVPELGYALVKVRRTDSDLDEWALAETLDREKPRRVRVTHPLRDTPALFKTFSDLAGRSDQENVLAFADRYGWLGVTEGYLDCRIIEGTPKNPAPVELIHTWLDAISDMRHAVDLIDAVNSDDCRTLKQWITWHGAAAVYQRKFKWGSHIYRLEPEFDQWLRDVMKSGDMVSAAKVVAQKFINQGLNRHTATRLLFGDNREALRLHVVPKNLLGAMWIQAAQAAEGGRAFRRCENCATWYAVAPELARSDRIYCSRNCRFKAYRKRKDEAHRLRSKGMAPSAIARAIGSDAATVRGWLAIEPGRKRARS